MKTKLEEARKIISEVDEEMISLFIKRMAAVKAIADYKFENNMEVLDSSREKALIEKNLGLLSNEQLEKYYLEFFQGVLNSSKSYQKDYILKKVK